MNGNEIRQKFLEFFERHGHRVVRSSPLLPAGDPTLLFTNAGMNQFKNVFLGLEPRDYTRAATSQKCVRAGGKHNDLDMVGRTARHHTFFEMLGNFSFGDYFKKEAIEFAWELLTKELKMNPARLWFSVFAGDGEVAADEEAARYWEEVGAPRERILRFGRKDNFWQMGDTGPCGPCSEIHYYTGENPEDPEFNRAEYVNGPGDTTVEIWNLVFMQFNRIGEGAVGPDGQYESYRLEPLPRPSVDTGAGLERFAMVLQGVKSNYETDLFVPITDFIRGLVGKEQDFGPHDEVSVRVIADHARATAFSIADGISPGNTGRNYVLRKIMRRAIYHGVKILRIPTPFFNRVTDFVVELMAEAYPELVGARAAIEQTVREEEQRFNRILTVGEPKLAELFERYTPATPPLTELARVYDTFGVPRDLIRVVLAQHGTEVEEEEFNEQFDEALAQLQQQSASTMAAGAAARQERGIYSEIAAAAGVPHTEFTGYAETETHGARVVAVITEGGQRESLSEGESGEVVLDRTPFYAESGGQVGDTGLFEGEDFLANVADTYAPVTGLYCHKTTVERGTLRVGSLVTARVDAERRRRVKANHTGTHLLHAALREVLGPHVKQAGSLVAPDRLRFDYTHFAPLTDEEVAEIERLVNREVLQNRALQVEVKPLEEAMRSGAMALFGEKYASEVRVVSVPGFSTELCGGTHVSATGEIGPFKIVSDSSIAAGVRRLEAVTADATIARLQTDEQVLGQITSRYKVQPGDLPAFVDRLQEQVRRYERELEQLRLKVAQSDAARAVEEAREVGGVRVLAQKVSNLDANGMRQLADILSQKLKTGVVVLGQATDGKVSLVTRVTDDLTKRLNAGQIVRELSGVVGGKGGGRPDMATGGGSRPENLGQALEASYRTVEQMLGAGAGKEAAR